MLKRGGLVAFPTETVYGLGADASNADAVDRLYEVKGRPTDHPCIVHLGDTSWLDRYGKDIPPYAYQLADAFWPGPLTIIVGRTDATVEQVSGGLPSVGLRVPQHKLALDLLGEFGAALVAPSANPFGKISPTTAAHVRAGLGDQVDLILDGGPCRVGVESTIVDCTGERPRILRPGGLTREQIESVVAVSTSGEPVRASGTLPTHYSTQAKLVVTAELDAAVQAATGRVAVFSKTKPAGKVEWIEAPKDVETFAHDLYAVLRALDERGFDTIIVEPADDVGLGVAINDRLRRAAQ